MATAYTVKVNVEGGGSVADEEDAATLMQQEMMERQRQQARNRLLANVAIQMGRDALSYGLSNMGELTGDYEAQTSIQTMSGIASSVAMLARGGVMGVVSATERLASLATTYLYNRSKIRHQEALLRERVGLETSHGRRSE